MIPTYFKIEILAKCCSWTTLCSKELIAKYSIVLFHYCVFFFFGTTSGRKFQFHFKIYKSLYEFEIHFLNCYFHRDCIYEFAKDFFAYGCSSEVVKQSSFPER